MAYDGWNLLGGFRLFVVALGTLLGKEMDFRTVDAFEMCFETGFTLVLVNLNGTGRAGVLREPIDSTDLSQ